MGWAACPRTPLRATPPSPPRPPLPPRPRPSGPSRRPPPSPSSGRLGLLDHLASFPDHIEARRLRGRPNRATNRRASVLPLAGEPPPPSATPTPQMCRARRDGSNGTLYDPYPAGRCRRRLAGKPPESRRKTAELAGKPPKPAGKPELWNSLEFTGSSAEFTWSNPIELRTPWSSNSGFEMHARRSPSRRRLSTT